MNGARALILLAILGTCEGRGYSESKKPGTQAKDKEDQGRLKKANSKADVSKAAPPFYFTGAFTSWDTYGLILAYQWRPAFDLQLEARSIRGNTDEYKDLKWTRHEDSFGIHQRYYKKDDSWCLSLGFISRNASFNSNGGLDEIPPDSKIHIRRHDIAFRVALGTQYQTGSFVWGFDWITIENRFLTLSTNHRATHPIGGDVSEGLRWDRRDTNELFDKVAYPSLRIGWRF
jgi:hypothetical protein